MNDVIIIIIDLFVYMHPNLNWYKVTALKYNFEILVLSIFMSHYFRRY